ncbi:MAG TPA: glycosyltransferase family 39 protein [Candidatus Angelobacter sp.]
MNQRTRILILQLAVILAVCAFLFFFGLGAFGLVGADEPRYSQIAREMLNRHDWIVPTLNGRPWLEKPAFLYWKIMNSYAIFGVHDWAARIPAAAHATTLALVIFFFMRRFRPGAEMNAALITASCAAMIAFGRGASTDMLLSAPFAMALLSWWAWHENRRRLWLAVFYALLAVGSLAKGPVAPVLAVLIVAAYAVLRRDSKIFVRSLWWAGFLLYFALVLPWYIAVQLKVPEFFRVFFIEHNLDRFGTNLYQHSQPFWYYIPVFLLSTAPWIVFTIMAIVDAAKTGVRNLRSDSGGSGIDKRFQQFLLIWIVMPIIFFSISRSKLPGYILPSIPASAILTADYLQRRPRALPRWSILGHSLVCGILVGLALISPARMLKVHLPSNAVSWIIVGTGLVAILVVLILRIGGARLLHFATLAPVILILTFLLRPAAPVIDEVNSARTVNARLGELGAPQAPISVFNVKREVEYGLTFYRNEAIGRYERDGVPSGEHIVIIREGSSEALRALTGERQISTLGNFPPQHLEFYLVSKQ